MTEKKPTKKWSEMNKAERVGGIIGLAIAAIIGTSIVGGVVSAVGTVISSHPTESSVTQKSSPITTYKNVATTAAIPFSKTSQNDATLASGTSVVVTAGVDGVKTQTFKVTYVDGIETTRNLLSEEITTQPVTEITSVGTYVAPKPSCTSGSYVNSAGNTVCSPEASSSAPAGASAQCSDGTYSFSQSRRGTCSHHGGVATWL